VEAPLALYRRYRPETYAEVIGQSHVTEPLQQALRNNRVHHAYLFSGPRGCGKTTSARILARCLNCEKGPTPEPCGTCQSCRDLARGGPGSIDVIEIDAASHGGVDDARDLRERAFFAPVAARYKIYIVDEAHMVTPQGFNALLKLVEEPPEHLKFIFATTEPDKVIGTIRSRTHHYPFRLVPPKLLQEYLADLCRRENVAIDTQALPLIVRAGGGSVRDTLSVLDQLIGGAGPEGVTYERAVALLGYTPDSLLDEIVDAFAARDGAGVFAVIDKVIESGQDPRRFAEDLLRRLRDLLVISAIPDAASRGLLEGSPDHGERLAAQAARFGVVELTHAADVLNTGLTDMRGATSPRLHLELMCARVLLPAADASEQGLYARLDRLERRMSISESHGPAVESAPDARSRPAPTAPQPTPAPAPVRTPAQPHVPPAASETPEPAAATSTSDAAGGMTLLDVRRLWPDILEEVKNTRRFTWVMLSQNAQVTNVHDNVLTVGLTNAGARDSFNRSGSGQVLEQVLRKVLGVEWRVEAVIDPSAGSGGAGGSSGPGDGGTRPPAGPRGGSPGADATRQRGPAAHASRSGESAPAGPDSGWPTHEGRDVPPRSRRVPREGAPSVGEPEGWSGTAAAADVAVRGRTPTGRAPTGGVDPASREASAGPGGARAGEEFRDPDSEVDPEMDSALTDEPIQHTELLVREFGAQVIEERPLT
jgi:DNA polymerase-3 subunit gamma/tau